MLPIVDTPTVGAVIQSFSRCYRTPLEGVFLNASQRGTWARCCATASAARWTWCW